MTTIRNLVLVAVVFALGAAFGAYLNRNRVREDRLGSVASVAEDPDRLSIVEDRGPPLLVPTGPNDEIGLIYARLGFRNGDGPKEVNGISVPSGFEEMIPAFRRGHLCVKYDRDGSHREVCFDRRAAGETVVDRVI